jgi:hypothetical protein
MAKPPPEYRLLRFETIDDVLAELSRLEAAEHAGTLRTVGRWSAGQILAHLATWIEFAYDGYPFRPPWYMRALGRLFRRPILRSRMPHGVNIPGAPGGTYGADDLPFPAALERFRAALARLRSAAPAAPNPLLGQLRHEQWIAFHLRHAEHHLGYVLAS